MLDPLDRRIVEVTQQGLPLTPRPFAEVGRRTGLSEAEVIERISAMQARGVIRRVAAAPNHYRLGTTANGMAVWDLDDEDAMRLGPEVGALDFVSHCYLRPRAPGWPYTLFAMIHGRDRSEVEAKRGRITRLLGDAARGSDILYSTRILKKTGLRLRQGSPPCSG